MAPERLLCGHSQGCAHLCIPLYTTPHTQEPLSIRPYAEEVWVSHNMTQCNITPHHIRHKKAMMLDNKLI